MKILAVETSCDDTAVAILEIKGNKNPSFNVLSDIVSSQTEIHKKYGGVYPAMAKREHQKNLAPTLELALKKARASKKNIDLIAVTNGPGLEPCLWVGVNFAKELAKKWQKPIVPVNHIESHILVSFLNINRCNVCATAQLLPTFYNKIFPAVCLVVSGGHTQLILMKKIGKYKILGETRDDAAGECLDKCARILDLGYPGGPAIAKLADTRCLSADRHRVSIHLPRPMINTKDYDFSFSGLKTAVLYHHKKQPEKIKKSKTYIQEMCAGIQQAIIDVLIKKTIKAAKDYGAKAIILGGGVSANSELRKQFQHAVARHCEGETRSNLNLILPPTNLSTDNAVMTAIAGYYNRKLATKSWQVLEAKANLRL